MTFLTIQKEFKEYLLSEFKEHPEFKEYSNHPVLNDFQTQRMLFIKYIKPWDNMEDKCYNFYESTLQEKTNLTLNKKQKCMVIHYLKQLNKNLK